MAGIIRIDLNESNGLLTNTRVNKAGRVPPRSGEWLKARECFYAVFRRRPFDFGNLRWWGLSYLPVARQLYRMYRNHKSTVSSFNRIAMD